MKFQSEKGFNCEEDLSLKTTRIIYTDIERGKTVDNPIDIREDKTKSGALKNQS